MAPFKPDVQPDTFSLAGDFAEFVDILNGDDLPQPTFPTELLPQPFRNYVTDIANRKQVPADFAAVPTIVMVAGAIGNRVQLMPMRHDVWKERPCLWAMMIAHTGTLKTPTMEEAFKPLKRLEAELKERWKEEFKAWQRLKDDDPGKEDKPVR